MNKKLVYSTLRALGLSALAIVAACDGDSGNGVTAPTDTKTDTGRPDATGTETTTTTSTDTTQEVGPSDPGTVKALQAEAELVTCDPAGIVDVNPSVTLTGAVVSAPKFDASPSAQPDSFDGFYVQDQSGGAYSGITLRVPRALAADLVPGDVIDATGQLKEAFCLTQLDVATLTEKTPVTPPTALVVPAAELAAEPYESMLVKVTGVTVSAGAVSGVYEADPGDFQISFGFPGFFLSLDAGKKYDLTGVLRYAFSKWQLVPRSQLDVVPEGGTPQSSIIDLQSTAESTGCTANSIQNFKTYEISGTIQTGKFFVTATLDGYYLTDGTDADYSGVLVVVDTSKATNFVPGDIVKITGQHTEFFCLTELKALSIEKTGSDGSQPTPRTLAKGAAAADLEKLEGVLVELSDVNVSAVTEFGESETDAGVLIDKGIMGNGFTAPAAGAKLTTLRGIVRYSFSKYRVSPRTAADMVLAQ